MSDTRRAALEAAFDQHEEAAQDDEQQQGAPQTEETTAPAGKEAANELDSGADAGTENVVTDEPAKGRVKDPLTGKFLPKQGEPSQKPLPKDGTDPLAKGQQQQVDPTKPVARGPVSWKPEIREKFASLPPEVQAEVNRREVEISQGFRQIEQVRNYAGAINRTIQPYEAMIKAEGGNHVTAVDNLLKTAYLLRTAPPQQKATMVAQMIIQHGVDLGMLDKLLDGVVNKGQPLPGMQQQPQDPTMQYIQRELAPIKQFFTQAQQRMGQNEEQITNSVLQEMQAFEADPKNEFYQDVKEDMATFLEIAAQRGVKMSLSEAYQRATLAHPTIGQTMISRQMQTRAAQQTAATRRARNASASLPSGGAPAGETTQKPKDRRSAIEAAWDTVEERQ